MSSLDAVHRSHKKPVESSPKIYLKLLLLSMTTPFEFSFLSTGDAQRQPPGTPAKFRKTPINQSLSKSEGDGKTSTPPTPVKLEKLENTPTKRKRELGEASGHDATVKKSPSVSGHSSSYLPRDAALGSEIAKSSSEAKVNDPQLLHAKRQLNFSQGETNEDDVASCSYYQNDICHQEWVEAVIKEEEDEEPVRSNEHLRELEIPDMIKEEEPVRFNELLRELEIPDHISQPEVVPVKRNELHKMVAFGVETTSLDWGCDIIQLECSDLVCGRENFSKYIRSKKKVHIRATEVNGLTNDGCILKQNGIRVQTISLEEGVLQLIEHLQENTILISHNTKGFQAFRLLLNVLLEKHSLLERLREKVVGFSDSYRIFLDLYPKKEKILPSYKLWKLIEYFSKGFKNRAFRKPINGIDNVMKITNLAELLRSQNLLEENKIAMFYKHSLTLDSALDKVHHCNMKMSNEVTFADMVRRRRLKKKMAQKMASSGLRMENLQRFYEVRDTDGLLELLNPRITKDLRVISQISLYFKETS